MSGKLISVLFTALALCGGCQETASSKMQPSDDVASEAAVQPVDAATTPLVAKPTDIAAKPQAKSPVASGNAILSNAILSKAASQGRADRGCAFIIRYGDTESQPLIRERDGDCNGLDAKFIAVSKLEEMGQLEDLSPVDAANIRSSPGGTVFYIEDGLTSSAYPLGDGDIAYEVVLAD